MFTLFAAITALAAPIILVEHIAKRPLKVRAMGEAKVPKSALQRRPRRKHSPLTVKGLQTRTRWPDRPDVR
ncbi:hypothetical protein [Glycomyces sp. NPDC021274]|uniref:hypothetical protein n=1 Tax=Glycomyces sp. NPDC021274 TaxID=3155120 RepID=UPI0033EB403B